MSNCFFGNLLPDKATDTKITKENISHLARLETNVYEINGI